MALRFGIWELKLEKVYKKHDENFWVKVTDSDGILSTRHDPKKQPQYAWSKLNDVEGWSNKIWIDYDDFKCVNFYKHYYILNGKPHVKSTELNWDECLEEFSWKGDSVKLLETEIEKSFIVQKSFLEEKHISEYSTHGA